MMKKNFSMVLLGLFFAAFAVTEASAVNSYEMQRYCKDEAAYRYQIEREKIYASVPRFLNGRYSVYSRYPKHTDRALFFVCDFDRNGRLLTIQTEKDLRRSGHRPVKPTHAAKRSCKLEASSVWRVSKRDVQLSNIRRVNYGRYKMTVQAGYRTAVCDVNAQGNIYSFRVERNGNRSSNKARRSCKRMAARYWDVPASRVAVEHARRMSSGRYRMLVRYGRVEGKCDVGSNGHIYHFRTMRRY